MSGSSATGIALALACTAALAQTPEPQPYAREQIRAGESIYAQNCAPCHGVRMKDGQVAFDLRTLTPQQKGRFVASVVKGKNQMPPWGDVFRAEEIEALWAYVVAGERP